MTALDPAWPGTLSDRAYHGRRALGGGWRIVAGDDLFLAPDARGAARALLCDVVWHCATSSSERSSFPSLYSTFVASFLRQEKRRNQPTNCDGQRTESA